MILLNGCEVKTWKFPAGETGVNISNNRIYDYNTIDLYFESNDDLINLLFVVNALRHRDCKVEIDLFLGYFPYARQDRVCAEGDSFSLQVIANLIKGCNFRKIVCYDLHSDVAKILFEGNLEVIEQHAILSTLVRSLVVDVDSFALISPDAGALKKIYPLSSLLQCNVIEAKKVRESSTGKIIKTSIDVEELLKYNSLVVVDDICDGGRTFVELGKVIRENYNGELSLVVTHGIFSKGKEELSKYFNNILCYNDMSKKEK